MDPNAWDACSCQQIKRSHPPEPNNSPAVYSDTFALQRQVGWSAVTLRSVFQGLRRISDDSVQRFQDKRFSKLSRCRPRDTARVFLVLRTAVLFALRGWRGKWSCFQLVSKVLIPLKITTYWFNDSAVFGVRLTAVMTSLFFLLSLSFCLSDLI